MKYRSVPVSTGVDPLRYYGRDFNPYTPIEKGEAM